jgi:hypothetical protein
MATTSTSSLPPPKCYFNALSGEMRNRIYDYFFTAQLTNAPNQTHIDIREDHPRLTRNAPKTRSALALTATSRQYRAETLALFWSKLSLKIVAGTLTTYSQPVDSIRGVHPMNRAHHINQDRAECLQEWLERSGVARFARFLRPVELDLGMYDPQVHADAHQFMVLRLLGGDTTDLTRLLQGLGRSKAAMSNSSHSSDDKNDSDNSVTTRKLLHPAGCTLRFKVQVVPSTALGSICVANERTQALASIAALCEGRSTKVQAQFQDGILTPNGRFTLLQDMAMCRSLAELLVDHIIKEEQQEEDEHVEGGGQVRKRKLASKKGNQGGS